MRNNPYTEEELNFIISIRHERTIDNASWLKYFNNYYLPIDIETGEVMSFSSGTKCMIVNTFDNKLFGIINEKTYLLILVEQPTNKITNASSNGFKPKADNPWRKFKIR